MNDYDCYIVDQQARHDSGIQPLVENQIAGFVTECYYKKKLVGSHYSFTKKDAESIASELVRSHATRLIWNKR